MTDDDEEGQQIRAENAFLKQRIADLEAQINFLSQHNTLARGLSGERLISGMIGGVRTVHTASVDIVMEDGTNIEVKNSNLSYPSPKKPGNRSRWQWGKIFGEKNAKDFDFIILVGEADRRYALDYKDSKSPYVIFLLSNEQAKDVVTAHTSGAKAVLLGADPRPSNAKARRFFEEFQLTAEELAGKFGSLGSGLNDAGPFDLIRAP